MTAFSRAQDHLDGMQFCWEIKSVNHRYLDVTFRLPEAWRFLEMDLRAALRGKVHRGKVECQLKVMDTGVASQLVQIHHELVDSLIAAANELAESKGLQNDLTVSSLLQWPGVVLATSPDVESLADPVIKVFLSALSQLQQARASEGAALKQHVLQRLHQLQLEIAKANALVENNAVLTQDKLLARLSSLSAEVDKSRLEQEIALMLARLDVSEELDRLTTHTEEVAKALNASDSVGRRLDFLMQELNREANTLGSKSESVGLTQCSVEMKVLIEQMREQIQNIE
jgi:uncharacterized protein (TIGR00255 family)